MQKLKKSFVLLLGIFLFSACGSLPQNPKIEICGHDQPNAQAECFDNQTNEYRSVPIEQTDNYIMFSADDWGLILIYIDKLRSRLKNNKSQIHRKISIELEKIIVTSELLE